MRSKRGFLAIIMLVIALVISGCADEEKNASTESDVKNIYATFFPLYAIADMISDGIDDIQLHCLVQPQDGCLREYPLSDWDLAMLGSADAVIAGGCGLESFETTLYNLGNSGPMVAPVFYNMDLLTQSAVNCTTEANAHWNDPNPHIYMKIDGAEEIAERIAAMFIMLDAENEHIYNDNLQNAKNRLRSFQSELRKTLASASKNVVIVMNEALVYAAAEYGLDVELYYARESGEEITGSDLENCINVLAQSNSSIVLIEKQAPRSLINALEENGFTVVSMDTMSTRRGSEGSEGYFNAHKENVRALTNAFSSFDSDLNP